MNAFSSTAHSWKQFVLRLALALALVLSQAAAAVPVIAQDEGLEPMVSILDPNEVPLQASAAEITTAAAVTQGVIDTTINEGSPATNYGFGTILQLGFEGSKRQRILIEPSLSALPPNATITSAKLRLYLGGYDGYYGEQRGVNFYRVTSPWHQSLTTYNNRPANGEAVASMTVTFNSSIVRWYEVDITTLVNNWVHGVYPNYGLLMTSRESIITETEPDRAPILQFYANNTANAPQLVVSYTTTAPTLDPSPTGLGFAQDLGGPVPAARPLKLNNNGSSIFSWTATASQSWIHLSPTSGQVGPGSSQTISVSLDSSAASRSGQITLTTTTSGALGFPRNIPVSVSVADFNQSLSLPLVSKAGTNTQPPAATRDVATLIIGIADYLHLTIDGAGASGERAGAWGEDLYFAGLDSTKEKRTLSVFGLQHDKDKCNCSGGISGAGLSPSNLPDAKNNILTLTDAEATYENIQAAFAWLDEHEGPNTTVQVFYSGHGGRTWDLNGDETQDDWDEFIAAYDSNYDETIYDYVNVVTDDQMDAWLSNLESTHVAVLLDSCYSGGMLGPGSVENDRLIRRGLPLPGGGADPSTPPSDPALDLAADLAKPGRDVLTASTVNEESLESPELQQGVFSYYLMMALLDPAADTVNDDIITVQEAYNYIRSRVSNYVTSISSGAVTQTPVFYSGVTGSVGLGWSTSCK